MLKTIAVGDITFSQAGLLHSMRVEELTRKLPALIKRKKYDARIAKALEVYPIFAACSSPEITDEQLLNTPENIVGEWLSAIMSLNPHWFGEASDEKKSALTQTESTED